MKAKSPPRLPPPCTAPSQPEPGGLKIAPEAQRAAAPVTFWSHRPKAGGQQEGQPPAPHHRLPGHQPLRARGRPLLASPSPTTTTSSRAMQRARGARSEDAGTRAPPSPGVPPKRAKVGAGGGAGAPVFLRPLRNAAVCAGSDVRLRVVVSGTPQPSLSWFRDGQLLPVPAPEPSCLWLQSCGAQDAGVYSCRAQNERGQASCEAVLTVLEVAGNSGMGRGHHWPGWSKVARTRLGSTLFLFPLSCPGGPASQASN